MVEVKAALFAVGRIHGRANLLADDAQVLKVRVEFPLALRHETVELRPSTLDASHILVERGLGFADGLHARNKMGDVALAKGARVVFPVVTEQLDLLKLSRLRARHIFKSACRAKDLLRSSDLRP
jgi:hypothetical protein